LIWERDRIKVEYPKDGRYNQGRLCPKGNGAGLVLSSPKRLTYPLWDGEVSWDEALSRTASLLSQIKPQAVGIILGRDLSAEERSKVLELAQALKIESVASGELGPEIGFHYRLSGARPAGFELMTNSQVSLIVGDLFTQAPVSAKPILDARYRDRGNRIIVVDSLKTHTAYFADEFLQPKPGTEALALLGMIKAGFKRSIEAPALVEISKACGVEPQMLERAGRAFDQAEEGVAILTPVIGRQGEGGLLALVTQFLARNAQGEKGHLFVGAGPSWRGRIGFGELVSLLMGDKLKILLSFGIDLASEYPQLEPVLHKLDQLISFVPFRPKKAHSNWAYLPLATNLEKEGTIQSSWGEISLTGVEPVSGARRLEPILNELARELELKLEPARLWEPAPSATDEMVLNWAQSFLDESGNRKQKRGYPFLLLGESPAIGFLGLFGYENYLKLNRIDMERLELKDSDEVGVRSTQDELVIPAQGSLEVPSGLAVLETNRPENRGMFELMIDPKTQDPIIPPIPAKIWKIGA
jgi:hypothetical protein